MVGDDGDGDYGDGDGGGGDGDDGDGVARAAQKPCLGKHARAAKKHTSGKHPPGSRTKDKGFRGRPGWSKWRAKASTLQNWKKKKHRE